MVNTETPITTKGLLDGTYKLYTADRAGNLSIGTTYTLDTVAPKITKVEISSSIGAQNNYLNAGDVLTVSVTTDEDVVIKGLPTITLLIGTTEVKATYDAASSTAKLLKFNYTILAGQTDIDGISVKGNTMYDGYYIRDNAGNDLVRIHSGVANNANYKVDTTINPIGITLGQFDIINDAEDENSVWYSVTGLDSDVINGGTVTAKLTDDNQHFIVGTYDSVTGKVSFDSANIKTLAQGKLVLEVEAKDVAGNKTTATNSTIIYDNIGASAPTLQATNGTVLRGSAEALSTVKIYSDAAGTTLIGTGTTDAGGNFAVTYTTQATGKSIYVKVVDIAGNESAYSTTKVKTPIINIVSISNDTGYLNNDFITSSKEQQTITGIVEGNFDPTIGDTVWVKLNNGTFIEVTNIVLNGDGTYSWSITNSNLSLANEGANNIYAQVISEGSTVAGVTHSVRLDTIAPTVSNFSAVDDSIITPTANFKITFAEEVVKGNGDITLVDDTTHTSTVISMSSSEVYLSADKKSLIINPTNNLIQGHDYHVEVSAGAIQDLAGNNFAAIIDATTWNVKVGTATISIDHPIATDDKINKVEKDAGVILSGTVSSIDPSILTNLTANDIEVTISDGSVLVTAKVTTYDSSNGRWTFSVPSTTLDDEKTYSITASFSGKIGNADGIEGSVTVNNIKTDFTAPNTPTISVLTDDVAPIIGTISDGGHTNDTTPTIKIDFGTDVKVGDTIQLYNGTTALGTAYVITATDIANHSATVTTPILSDASYSINAKIIDSSGNISTASTSHTIVVDSTPPSTTITSVNFSSDTGSSSTDFITKTALQTISGALSANLLSDEIVKVSLDNGLTWTNATTTTGSSSLSLAGVTLSSTSNIKVKVTDLAGNESSTYTKDYTLDTTAATATLSTEKLPEVIFDFDGLINSAFIDKITLNDGTYLIIGFAQEEGASDKIICMQKFNSDGTKIGNVVVLERNITFDMILSRSIKLSDNSFIFGYYKFEEGSILQKINSDGTITESKIILTSDMIDFELTSLKNGSYVGTYAVWENQDDAHPMWVNVAHFNPDGTSTIVRLDAPEMINKPDLAPKITTLTDGSYVVSYTGTDWGEYNRSIYIQKFNSDGTISGSQIKLASLTAFAAFASSEYDSEIEALPNGGFVVTCSGFYRDPITIIDHNAILFQIYDKNGVAVGEQQWITGEQGNFREKNIEVFKDGSFVISASGTNYNDTYSIYIQKFNANGTPATDVMKLEESADTSAQVRNPKVKELSDGSFVLIYFEQVSSPVGHKVYTQKFNIDGSKEGTRVLLDVTADTIKLSTDIHELSDGSYMIEYAGSTTELFDFSHINTQVFNSNGTVKTALQAQSSELGMAYLVNSSIIVNTLADITNANDTLYNSVAITAINTPTPISKEGLAEGKYYLYTVDVAGNISSKSAGVYTVDTTAPNAPSITSVTDNLSSAVIVPNGGFTKDSTPTIKINFTSDIKEGDTLQLYHGTVPFADYYVITAADISNGYATITTAPLKSGTYALNAKITDVAGNQGVASSSYTINIDYFSTTPVINSIAGDNKINASEQASVITGTAEANASVSLTIGANTRTLTADASGNWTYTLTPADITSMGQGTKTISAVATDTMGNVSLVTSQTVIVDTIVPNVPLIHVIAGNDIINSSEQPVVISGGSDAYSTIKLTVAGSIKTIKTVSSGNWNYTLTPEDMIALGEGTGKVITATQTDEAGNTSAATTRVIMIDTIAPNTPVINTIAGDNTINASEVTSAITGTSEANATIKLTIGANTRTITADASGNWTYSLTPADITAVGQGNSTITVTQTDVSGNTSISSSKTINVDTIAPNAPVIDAIASDNVVNISEQTSSITGTCEANAIVTLTIAGNTRNATVTGTTWSYSLIPEDITAMGQGTETISVTQTDTSGNTSIASTRTISVDTIAPNTSILKLAIDSGSISTDGITNSGIINVSGLESGATWQYSLDAGANWTTGTGTSFTLLDGTYTTSNIKVKQIDAAGNSSNVSATIQVYNPQEIKLEATSVLSGEDTQPRITSVGTAGEYVVTYYGKDTEGDYSVFVQKFNANGTTQGSQVKLEATGVLNQYDIIPEITAVGTAGEYVVTYVGSDTDGVNAIFVQKFNADGTLQSSQVKLEPTGNPSGHVEYPKITALGTTGEYAVTYLGRDSINTFMMYIQKFNVNGTANGSQIVFTPNTLSMRTDEMNEIISTGTDGSFVLGYLGQDTDGDYSIFVQKFNSDGTTRGSQVKLEATGVTNGYDVNVHMIPVGSSGEYVVSFDGVDSNGDYSVFVQKFNANGTIQGSQVQLEATGATTGMDSNSQITAIGTAGEYVVAYHGIDTDGDSSLYIQRFNANGTTNGAQIKLEATDVTNKADTYPHVAAIGTSGAFVVAYTGIDTNGNNSVFVQKFDADSSFATPQVKLERTAILSPFTIDITAVGTAGEFTVTYKGLDKDGDSSIFVQKFNADGSLVITTTDLTTIVVDTVAPSAPIVNTIATDDIVSAIESTSVITGTCEEGATISLAIGTATRTATVTGTTWSYSLTSTDIALMGQGSETILVKQIDSAGNVSVPASKTITVDTVAPTPTMTTFTSLNTGNATVKSNEVSTAYLVKNSVTVTTLADITSASDSVWNSVSIDTVNTDTSLSLAGLEDGTYRLYTVDAVGNLSSASSNIGTITSDTTPPTLISSTPADNGFISSVSSNLTFTFSENIKAGTGYIKLYNLANTLIEQFDVASSANITGWNSSTLSINPTSDLALGTNYYIQIDTTAVKDLSGNAYAGITDTTTLNFATFASGGGVNLSSIDAGNGGFVINGQAAGDYSGWSVSSAGDVNGDGIADLIVGAYASDPATGSAAGRSYVVFGKTGTTAINLSAIATGNGGFVINGQSSDYSGHSVSSAGDVNGDGLSDLIVGAVYPGGSYVGRSYVVFGKSSNTTEINLSAVAAGVGGYVINGQCASDESGYSVSSAGDVNGDGLADLIIGAPYLDIVGYDDGRSYVVFGKTANTTAINLSAIATGSGGFVINGQCFGDLSGYSVSSAGDVNGDGLADLIVGARYSDPSIGGSGAGRSYVVFGKTANTTAINLSAIATGNGGFVINGQCIGDQSGYSVSSAGDVNGDGLADLIVGADNSAPLIGGGAAGRSYVVFGKSSNTTAIELSAIATGNGGFVINGQCVGDCSGYSVSSAGDVNGDGLADLIVGADYADPDARSYAGRSYVVYGKTGTASIELSAIAAGNGGFVINGQCSNDYSGGSVSSAGDINGDGLADLIVGAYNSDPAVGGSNAGRSYVIFGGTQFATTVDYLGGANADSFAGTATAETFVLGLGNDTANASGADIVYAGAGNDTITVDSTMITALASKFGAGGNTTQLAMIDGGGGFDTIALSGGSILNLTTISNIGASGIEENSRIESIEKIDLKTDTSANTLILTSKDVQDMAGMNQIHLGLSADGNTWASGTYTLTATMQYHQLVISASSGDIINIMETTWVNSGNVTSNGITYNVYTNATARTQLFVENGATVNLNTSPIMLDLNNDGIHTTSLDNSNVVFDNNADGTSEHMAWSDGKDGFLVLDLNQDGIINSGNELFGSGTTLENGTKAKDGYEALKQYDDNKDNIIDVNDSIFAKLQIWIDSNVDGITTNDELKTLQDLDIKSLNLLAQDSSQTDNGNILGLVSNYTKTDGTKQDMADVWFNTTTWTQNESSYTPVVVYSSPIVEEEKKETTTF